jgi:hypothetical protein
MIASNPVGKPSQLRSISIQQPGGMGRQPVRVQAIKVLGRSSTLRWRDGGGGLSDCAASLSWRESDGGGWAWPSLAANMTVVNTISAASGNGFRM